MYDSVYQFVARMKYPILTIFIVGMIIRLLLCPISVSDDYCWFLSSDNFMSNLGLYDRDGYYYGPAFAYIMSLGVWVGTTVFGEGILAIQVDELAQIQFYHPMRMIVTTMAFNFMEKSMMILGDIMVGILIYWIGMRLMNDKTKATLMFGLWFLSPLVINESSVHGMFDCYSALLTLLSLVFLYREKYFIAGLTWSSAVLVKIFPIYLLPLYVVYILYRYRGDIKVAIINLVKAIIGAIVAILLIYYPVILNGTFWDSWSFLLNRAAKAGSVIAEGTGSIFENINAVAFTAGTVIQVLALFVAIILAYVYYKENRGEKRRCFLMIAMLSIGTSFLWVPMPQYLILFLPIIILYMVMYDKRYFLPMLLIAIGGPILNLMMEGPGALLIGLGTFTDIVDLNWAIDIAEWYFGDPRIGDYGARQVILSGVGAVIQFIGTALLFVYPIDNIRKRKEICA